MCTGLTSHLPHTQGEIACQHDAPVSCFIICKPYNKLAFNTTTLRCGGPERLHIGHQCNKVNATRHLGGCNTPPRWPLLGSSKTMLEYQYMLKSVDNDTWPGWHAGDLSLSACGDVWSNPYILTNQSLINQCATGVQPPTAQTRVSRGCLNHPSSTQTPHRNTSIPS